MWGWWVARERMTEVDVALGRVAGADPSARAPDATLGTTWPQVWGRPNGPHNFSGPGS